MIHIGLYLVFLVLVAGYAGFRGGAPERIAAAGMVIGTALTFAAQASLIEGDFGSVELGVMLVDTALLALCFALAIVSSRFWPLWLSALMIVQVASHLPKLLSSTVPPFSYAIVLGLWGYPLLLTIAVGTWRHRTRLKAHGADPSWAPFFEAWMKRRRKAGRIA
jgi:hypothetical protein